MMRLLVINSSNNLLHRALQARSLRLTVVKGAAALLMVVAVLTSASLAAPQYASATGNPFPSSGPEFSGAADGPTSPVEVGQSFSIYFRVMNITSLADHGGVSVSFPKFTQLGAGSDYYSSSQGSVNTRFYATGDSNVSYYERGDLLWNSRNEQKPAKHLLVETDDASWPTTAYRVLELEVTPKQAGTFKIYYRFWICGDGYSDCTRKPTGRDVYGLDQQGWAAGALIIQVEEPRPENRAPSASAVSPLASLILRAGDRQGFTARATDPDNNISQVRWLVNSREMSGESLSLTGSVDRTYFHTFSSAGSYHIEAVFTDTEGASDSTYWDVVAIEPPVVRSLGCSATRVQVGETVSCNPNLGGGSPTRYLWGSIGGTPWSGTERNYATHWDSPGQKQIAFEVCNDGGCDTQGHKVVVEPPTDPAPRINRLGCSATRVQVGETVSCNPNLGGGSPTRYLWGSIGGTPWSGTERNYATHWDSPGQKQIAFEVCNDGGCDTQGHKVVVEPPTDPAPRINRLGCSATRVQVGETVSCNPNLGGGSPTRYLWGSIGGTPWSGTERNYATHWDSPGQKQIAFEVCNDGGCDTQGHKVVVEPPTDPAPRINRLDCSSAGVKVGETVSCRPVLTGGSPTRYQWGAIGGSPSSGNRATFATDWDSPGNKQIALEVCNDGGCDAIQSLVVVDSDPPATLRFNATGAIIPGSSIDVIGSGFRLYSMLDYLKIGSRTVPLQLRQATDGNGAFQVTIVVPNLPPATYDLVAEVDGKVASTTIRIESPPPPNRSPTVSHVLPLQSLRLDAGSGQVFTAEANDPDENLSTVEWFFNGTPMSKGSLHSTRFASESLIVDALSPGNHYVIATFTDTEGASESVEWRFEVVPPPQVDSLGCSPITVQVEETVRCKPSLSGGDTATYAWEAEGGTLWSGYREDFSTSWGASGKKEIGLKVCNDRGVCDQEVQAITVEPPTPPPQVDSLGCSPITVQVEETVRCKPSLSGGDTATYAWEAEGGTLWSGYREDFSTSWGASGKKEIGLKVCNDRGVCDQEVQAITVEPPTPPPQVDNQEVQAITAEPPTPTPQVDNQEVQAITAEPPTSTPQVNSQGVQAITAEPPTSTPQVNSQGVQAITVVLPTPPPQVDSMGCSPITVQVEQTVRCKPSLSGGDTATYTWEAEGGTPRSGNREMFSTKWSSSGQKHIMFEMCNSVGYCSFETQRITVEDLIYVGDQNTNRENNGSCSFPSGSADGGDLALWGLMGLPLAGLMVRQLLAWPMLFRSAGALVSSWRYLSATLIIGWGRAIVRLRNLLNKSAAM